jgi:hypothetical protein
MNAPLIRLAVLGLALSAVQACTPQQQTAQAYKRRPPVAPTQTLCAQPAEKPAFQVASLKSELMVLGLSCNARDRYNEFVTRYQRDLRTQESALNKYFAAHYGRNAQHEHDDYITQLANVQSDDAVREGNLYCTGSAGLFDRVMSMPANASLESFVASEQNIPQPVQLVACNGRPASGSPIRRTSSHTAVHHSSKPNNS